MIPAKPFAILILLTVSLVGSAASPATDPHVLEHELTREPNLTLSAVVDAALLRDPGYGLVEAREREAGALSRRGDSLLGGEPALFLRHESDSAASDFEYREYEAGVELPLWRFKERAANRRLGEEAGVAAQAQARLLRLQVAGEVREVVWASALAHNALQLARSNVETARALENQVARRVEQGDLAQTDLLLARDETLQREVELQQARLDLSHALLAYRRLTGLEALPLKLSEVTAPGTAAAEANPYQDAPRAELERSRAQLEQTRESSGGAPVLFLGGKRVDVGVGEDLDTLEASISFPIGNSHSTVRQAQAAVQVAESEARLARARRELERRQHEAEHELAVARRTLSLAEERARLAERSLKAYQRGFDLGELTLAEFLRERRRALAAINEAAQRRLELDREIARYNQARGIVP